MSNRIEQSIQIDAEPGVVFEALTTPELVRRWLCHEAEVEPRVGGRYEMHWSAVDRGAAIKYEGSGEILDFSPGKRLAFRLEPADAPGAESVVEFRIEPRDGASEVTLVQSGFVEGIEGSRVRDAYRRGWTGCLRVLRSLLEDDPASRIAPSPMSRDIPTPGADPCGIAWDGSHVWTSDAGTGRIYRQDPVTGRVGGSFVFEGEPSGLAFDGECLWQADREERVVVKLGVPGGRMLKRLSASHVQGELTGVAWDGQYLWLGDSGEEQSFLLKVQPRSGIVFHKIEVPAGVSGLAFDGAKLWVAEYEARTLSRVDPQDGKVVERRAVKGNPTGLTWDGERLWYADAEWKLVSRILEPIA